MTEDEAKTKWCFAAVASHTNPRAGFDDPAYPKVFPCIASACMAWRWDLDGFDLDFDEAGPIRVRKTKLAHGYCGLAGRP